MADQTSIVNDTQALCAEAVRRILSVGSPLKIVLFGSHARCQTHPGSDLDLLIVEERSALSRHERALPYRMALMDLDIDKDIEVWTTEEILEWSAVPLAFITTILREGKVLYEKPR